jgi:hypothetical protein
MYDLSEYLVFLPLEFVELVKQCRSFGRNALKLMCKTKRTRGVIETLLYISRSCLVAP